MKKRWIILIIIIVILLGAVAAVLFVPQVNRKTAETLEKMLEGELKTALNHRPVKCVGQIDESTGTIRVLMSGETEDLTENHWAYVWRHLGRKLERTPEDVIFSVSTGNRDGGDQILKTVTSSMDEYGNYLGLLNWKDFSYRTGDYEVSASYTKSDGEKVDVVGKGFQAQFTREGIQVDSKGMNLVVSDLKAPEEVVSSFYRVWYSEDQSDLEDIPSSCEEGVYSAHVSFENHNYYIGDYQVQFFIRLGEMDVLAGAGIATFCPENFVRSNPENARGTRYAVAIINAEIEGVPAASVQFVTYPESEGASSAKSTEGTPGENNSWTASIAASRFYTAGRFITDIYGYSQTGEEVLLGSTQYDMSLPGMVALTFDDGPGKYTDRLLDQLEACGAHATFFVVGTCAYNYASVLSREEAIGCEVGNHTYDHTNLAKADADTINSTMGKCNSAIANALGHGASIMRPPGGNMGDLMKSLVGMPMILWNIDTMDWSTKDTQATIDCVQANVSDGDIILMHDIHEPTIEAAVQLIPWLIDQGYELLTVSELAAAKGYSMSPGVKYSSFK